MNDNFSANCPPPVGAQIRELRRAKGWTLQALADRAGTSAPTIHRYEGGWDRFELATLRKIAAALGAQLRVQLLAGGPAGPKQLASGRVVELLAPLFWEKPLVASDLTDYPNWVLRRVLMFGTRAQVDGARAWFGDEAILGAAQHRSVDARTRCYWKLVLGDRSGASEST